MDFTQIKRQMMSTKPGFDYRMYARRSLDIEVPEFDWKSTRRGDHHWCRMDGGAIKLTVLKVYEKRVTWTISGFETSLRSGVSKHVHVAKRRAEQAYMCFLLSNPVFQAAIEENLRLKGKGD